MVSDPSQELANHWPHAPVHKLNAHGAYIVTAGTYLKDHFFKASERLDFLQNSLLTIAKEYHWHLQSWAIFSNHYHFIATCSESAKNLPEFISKLHATTALFVNKLDDTPERRVWHNYRDTQLTFLNSYFARLNYVNQNPVKHKIVKSALDYRWCSASWFEENSPRSFSKTIGAYKIDDIKIYDDY